MNPSNGDVNIGFSNLTFNSQPISRSSSGLSRPRLVKVRKQVSSNDLKPLGNFESKAGPGFNPFRQTETVGFEFGVGNDSKWNDLGNVVAGELQNLNMDSDPLVSKLPDEMQKISINDTQNHKSKEPSFNFKSNAQKEFIFSSSKNVSNSVVENQLFKELDKLKINTNDFGAKSGSSLGVEREKVLSFDMERKLNIGRGQPTGAAASSTPIIQFGATAATAPKQTVDFGFSSTKTGIETPVVEFKTPNLKGTPFPSVNKKVEFGAKREAATITKPKRKGKSKQKVQVSLGQDFILKKHNARENMGETTDSYSPMDISPYQETQYSREGSVVSDESVGLNDNHTSMDLPPSVSNDAFDEELAAAAQRMDINEGKETVTREEGTKKVIVEHIVNESVSGAESESFKSAAEEMDSGNDSFVTASEPEVTSRLKVHRQDSDGVMPFNSHSNSEASSTSFTFAAASSNAHGPPIAAKHHSKKKNWVKVGQDSYDSALNTKIPFASSSAVRYSQLNEASLPLSPAPIDRKDSGASLRKFGNVAARGQEIKNESSSSSVAAEDGCEKWRLRGNQAYTSGNLSKAEDCYTQGINTISKTEKSRNCLRALMLCYSNRAATRMSLGRMRDAIGDCMLAAAIDPNFLKVQVRAANCYLALGEIEDAVRCFKKCLQSGSDICVDRKVAVESSEGLQKAQKVYELMRQSTNFLEQRRANEAEKAVEAIAEALSISLYSEKLLEIKAEALFTLRTYEEVIKLCEQTFASAEKNSHPPDTEGAESPNDSNYRIWRCCYIVKSYFYLGKLEDAVAFLEKQEELFSAKKRTGGTTLESTVPLAATVRELLRLKAAGNEAFQSGRNTEAVQYYTAALSCSVESRPFTAVCFCNRAAAFKASGQIADAIADCNLAIALDGNYSKAISRRAMLFGMIRDYGQAANDLQRLISFLTKQIQEKTNQSGTYDRSTNFANELRQARLRLSEIENEAGMGIPLDMYLILGIESSVSASEIRKAYRKAALRHHPDKAGQSLSRNNNGGEDGLWKELGEDVHRDAERLFKMIGEAYAVLSDPTKRSNYDHEEETRKLQKRRDGGNASRGDAHNYPYDNRTGNRRQWGEVWRAYSNKSDTTRPNRYPL